MNLKEFLKYSNSEAFYLNSTITGQKFIVENQSKKAFCYFQLEDQSDDRNIIFRKFELCIEGYQTSRRMDQKLFLPFIQLNLYKDHPLLWVYTGKVYNCELIGYPKDIDLFLGKIFQVYLQRSNNWIQASKEFFATEHAYKKKNKITKTLGEKLIPFIEEVCQKHHVDFKIMNEETFDFYSNKSKALIFENFYISPDGFNIGQPYIIAEYFSLKQLQ